MSGGDVCMNIFFFRAVGFMFIFVLFLMLFTAICFILGAHLEKGCYSVREETLYSDVRKVFNF